jgi:hypothetical protein
VIECPIPDKDIRRFDANIRLFPPFIDNDICPLTINNTLLQSCYLRNTEWACGVAVYTGNLLILSVLFHVTARLIQKVKNDHFSGTVVKCCITINVNKAVVDIVT